MAAGDHGAWAVGLRYLNYGKIEGYDEFGTPTGAFTPSDLVVEGTYSRDITDRWRGGVNIKMAYSQYQKAIQPLALAADLGVNYYDDEHGLSFSMVLRNMWRTDQAFRHPAITAFRSGCADWLHAGP